MLKSQQEQVIENISEYELFRMQKLHHKGDDDSISAHFSNNHSNFTDRENDQQLFEKPSKAFTHAIEYELRQRLEESERQRKKIEQKYQELERKYQEVVKQSDYYKKKYDEKRKKDKQTKQKLDKWVQDVKTDLQQIS